MFVFVYRLASIHATAPYVDSTPAHLPICPSAHLHTHTLSHTHTHTHTHTNYTDVLIDTPGPAPPPKVRLQIWDTGGEERYVEEKTS